MWNNYLTCVAEIAKLSFPHRQSVIIIGGVTYLERYVHNRFTIYQFLIVNCDITVSLIYNVTHWKRHILTARSWRLCITLVPGTHRAEYFWTFYLYIDHEWCAYGEKKCLVQHPVRTISRGDLLSANWETPRLHPLPNLLVELPSVDFSFPLPLTPAIKHWIILVPVISAVQRLKICFIEEGTLSKNVPIIFTPISIYSLNQPIYTWAWGVIPWGGVDIALQIVFMISMSMPVGGILFLGLWLEKNSDHGTSCQSLNCIESIVFAFSNSVSQ